MATVNVLISTSDEAEISLEEFNKSKKYKPEAALALRLAWKSATLEKDELAL